MDTTADAFVLIAKLHKCLDRDKGGNDEVRLELASLYQEEGLLAEAAFQLWMVKYQKRPFHYKGGPKARPGWYFFSLGINPRKSHAYLGGPIALRMCPQEGPLVYKSRAQAESALKKALIALNFMAPAKELFSR